MRDDTILLTVLLSSLVLFAALVVALFFIAVAHRRRQQLVVARISYEQELRTVADEIQERTLMSVAGELHDNIGQQLTLLRLQLETFGLKHPEAEDGLRRVSTTLAQTADAVRSLSHSLHSTLLMGTPLGTALEAEIQRLNALGRIEVCWDPAEHPEAGLLPDQTLVAFRLFQEAVQNTLKHAAATRLTVRLQSAPFELYVADNGRGYDAHAVPANAGAGLRTAGIRAALTGLRCTWNSVPGQGSSMTLCAMPASAAKAHAVSQPVD